MLPVLNQDISYVSSNDFSADYALIKKIGEGSFSDVWLCVNQNDGKQLTAKILKRDFDKTANANTLSDVSEVRVARVVGRHPFLRMVEGVYHQQNNGKIVLFAELMRRSLRDVIEDDELPLSACRLKSYTYQMLEGLRYLHKQNFIHRDIKPENILLNWRDVKIADFGAACHVAEGQPFEDYVTSRWYRSPECILTQGWYGKKIDIWSMGCVIYEMATGKPLFNGRDENDQLEKIDWVLGHPDRRLIDKFKKHKSVVFDQRYETSVNKIPLGRRKRVGVGLHTVYHPYQPAYYVLKEMIVYDPGKRYSADRLLRMPYFNDLKNSSLEYQVRVFEDSLYFKRQRSLYEGESGIPWIFLQHEPHSANKNQGPGGDRVQSTPTNTIKKEKVNQWIYSVVLDKSSTVKIKKSLSTRPPFK